jgi:uracil-DNA glycosylase family 4
MGGDSVREEYPLGAGPADVDAVGELHRKILSCTLCRDAGFIERAAPVVAGRSPSRMMLIGQAPGVTELQVRKPFAGRAGRELFRWMASIGIAEEEFRDRVYMTAVTKCFPGRTAGGSGDRRPSRQEINLCAPFLEAQLALIRPRAMLLVGTLAIERFFPRTSLDLLIGNQLERDGMLYIPLPHPSGASRWLNDHNHRELLRQGLEHVRQAWDVFVLSATGDDLWRVAAGTAPAV